MIAAPAVLVIAETAHPKVDIDGAEWLAYVSASAGRQYWAHLLGLLALVLFIPATACLGLGLYLERVVVVWQAALIALPVTVGLASEAVFAPRIIAILMAFLFLIGLGSAGWRILTESSNWERRRAHAGKAVGAVSVTQ